jgi:hypothetical protein
LPQLRPLRNLGRVRPAPLPDLPRRGSVAWGRWMRCSRHLSQALRSGAPGAERPAAAVGWGQSPQASLQPGLQPPPPPGPSPPPPQHPLLSQPRPRPASLAGQPCGARQGMGRAAPAPPPGCGCRRYLQQGWQLPGTLRPRPWPPLHRHHHHRDQQGRAAAWGGAAPVRRRRVWCPPSPLPLPQACTPAAAVAAAGATATHGLRVLRQCCQVAAQLASSDGCSNSLHRPPALRVPEGGAAIPHCQLPLHAPRSLCLGHHLLHCCCCPLLPPTVNGGAALGAQADRRSGLCHQDGARSLLPAAATAAAGVGRATAGSRGQGAGAPLTLLLVAAQWRCAEGPSDTEAAEEAPDRPSHAAL